MDARFGDPSISAPTQGSWNEMPPLRPVKSDFAQSDKVSRFKLMRTQSAAETPGHPVGTERANFPRHPMVDMQNHQRSASVDRNPGRLDRQRSNNSMPRLSSSSHGHRRSYESCSASDEDERDVHGDENDATDKPYLSNRSLSRDRHQRVQNKAPRQHKSPPLSSTAVMRRYSSQSESTHTYSSTPSTASFSSKRTSMTTPGLHGFSGSTIPPLLKEEEHALGLDDYPPPLPSSSHTQFSLSSSPPSASHGSSRGPVRAKRPSKRQNAVPVGPQELVPSNDELWGY